jgi:anaerobic magnesium-protoporphyrin IX monomethyl ester cyclase
MTEILLGQSYFLRFDPKLWQQMQPYPPLGTLYAASVLRREGYRVALFDAMLAESESEWAQALERHRPEYAVLFEDNFNYLSKMCLLRMRQAAFTMIGMAKLQGCTVILCGADATDHTREYLDQGADFILLGEGEETLGELMDRLTGRTGTAFGDIAGLAWRRGPVTNDEGEARQPASQLSSFVLGPWSFVHGPSSVVHENPRRPDIRDLDALPFPAWDLVDIPRYRALWLERHGYYSMNLVTTRGCPYHCNWCAKPIWGQRYNSRSPENVVAEIKWLKEQYHPDHIWFADDILGLKPGWIERFAGLLAEADAVIPFKCLQRADLINEKIASALRAAGCKTVWVGAESGSQRILDAMDKGDRVEDMYNAAFQLKKAGIEIGFFLQFGYPGEGWEDIQRTIKMVREAAPDDIGISVSYPMPGTKFFERVKLELGEKQNWNDSDDLAMLYRGPYPQAFYRTLHTRIHNEFRLRRAWRTRDWKRMLRAPYFLMLMARAELRLRGVVRRHPTVPEAGQGTTSRQAL